MNSCLMNKTHTHRERETHTHVKWGEESRGVVGRWLTFSQEYPLFSYPFLSWTSLTTSNPDPVMAPNAQTFFLWLDEPPIQMQH